MAKTIELNTLATDNLSDRLSDADYDSPEKSLAIALNASAHQDDGTYLMVLNDDELAAVRSALGYFISDKEGISSLEGDVELARAIKASTEEGEEEEPITTFALQVWEGTAGMVTEKEFLKECEARAALSHWKKKMPNCPARIIRQETLLDEAA